LYFAGEGRRGIPRRVQAWQQLHGIIIPHGRFYLPRTRIEIDPAGARIIATAIAELPEPPALVIVDTVARSLPAGSDENSARDMGEFINAVDGLRDSFGCVVCLVHHTGHSSEAQGRARGSSAFRAAMDWELCVDKKRAQIRPTKMKDSELPDPIGFALEQVVESAVAVFGEVVKPAGPALTKGEELGLSTLKECFSRLRKDWATVEEWRSDFYKRHTGDTPAAKRQGYHRTREGLVSKGLVVVNDDVYRLSVTSVTKRDSVTPVTGCDRDNRDDTLKGVTYVTPPDLPVRNVNLEVVK
jgi:hypothetical protein